MLLGLVWSPCVGPTLGAATVLASQGRDLGAVAAVMAAFGLGIAPVLMGMAFATRSLLGRLRGALMQTGACGKLVLGALVAAVGVFILTRADRVVEGAVVAASPQWLTDLALGM